MSDLRCCSCSKFVGTTDQTLRLVALFKASVFGRIPKAHPDEVRKRCSSCGFVNIYHPAKVLQRVADDRIIEVK